MKKFSCLSISDQGIRCSRDQFTFHRISTVIVNYNTMAHVKLFCIFLSSAIRLGDKERLWFGLAHLLEFGRGVAEDGFEVVDQMCLVEVAEFDSELRAVENDETIAGGGWVPMLQKIKQLAEIA